MKIQANKYRKNLDNKNPKKKIPLLSGYKIIFDMSHT